MWIGGYDDWTPAEQREWDRDLEEMQAEREQREREARTRINSPGWNWLWIIQSLKLLIPKLETQICMW